MIVLSTLDFEFSISLVGSVAGPAAEASWWVALVLTQWALGGLFYNRYQWFRRWWQTTRPGRRLWGLNNTMSTTIIITSGTHFDDGEKTETVYPAEARAAAEVEDYLRRVYPKMEIRTVTSATAHAEHLMRGNVISIGGARHNAVSQRFLQRSPLSVQFNDYDLVTKSGTFSALIEDGHIVQDFALVVIADNPDRREGKFVLIAGCRTFGCLVGARALVRSDVGSTLKALGDSDHRVFIATGHLFGDEVTTVEVTNEPDLVA